MDGKVFLNNSSTTAIGIHWLIIPPWYRQVTSGSSVVAILNVRRPHLFRRDEPPSISVFNLPMEEMVFLILVLLYSETKRQDSVRDTVINIFIH